MKTYEQRFLRNLIALFVVTVVFHGITVPFAAIADGTRLETMTVTAQKQEENVQDVPMSISVFSDIHLDDAGIENVLELTRFTPNVFMKNFLENEIVIRGISAPRSSLNSPAGFYVDDISYSIPFMHNPDLFDVERIEVLKGPQGTLYGRNSESGVINIVSKKPDNQARGKIFGEYGIYDSEHGNIGSYRAGGNASGPVVRDKLYLGFSGQWENSDGFVRNTLSNDDKAAEIDRLNGRATIRWTPSDRWDVSLITDYLNTDDGLAYARYFDGPLQTDRHEIVWDGENLWDQESSGQALRFKYEARCFDLLSITARRKWKVDFGYDVDSSSLPYGDWLADYDNTIISQELRVSSKQEKTPIKWILGLYGFDEDTDVISDMPSYFQLRDTTIENTGYAVFGQITYTFLERVHISGGLRYDYLETCGDQTFTNMGDENRFKNEKDYQELLPKASVSVDITGDVMAYATVAQGYLAGGYNQTFVTSEDNFEYDPEYTWNYEVGMKTVWLDNKLNLNAAAFYIDIKDKQVIEWLPGHTTFDRDITNAGEAHSAGIELEILARPVNGVDLFAGVGYLDTAFNDWTSVELDGGTYDYEGNELPFASNFTYNAGIQYHHPTGLFGRLDITYIDDFYSDTKNESRIDAYTLVNLRLGYQAAHYEIVLWGKNIFDEEYVANGGLDGTYFLGTDGEPRMIGVTLTYLW